MAEGIRADGCRLFMVVLRCSFPDETEQKITVPVVATFFGAAAMDTIAALEKLGMRYVVAEQVTLHEPELVEI